MSSRSSLPVSLSEMREFAGFAPSTQRYIRRSLDVSEGCDAVLTTWARDAIEAAQIRAQARIYGRIPEVRSLLPDDSGILSCEAMMSPLVTMAAFDLSHGRLPSFSAFRFLYERLLGGRSRPWLPSAFMAGAGLPAVDPDLRGALLKSLSEAAATAHGWTVRDPVFFPIWVEKVEPVS